MMAIVNPIGTNFFLSSKFEVKKGYQFRKWIDILFLPRTPNLKKKINDINVKK